MKILTVVAAAATMITCNPASAGEESIGTAYRITGIGCIRVEDASRLLREMAINAAVISSRRDIILLAEREGISCRILHGMDAVFAGVVDGPTTRVAGIELEIVHIARKLGDLYTWRPVAKPGVSL